MKNYKSLSNSEVAKAICKIKGDEGILYLKRYKDVEMALDGQCNHSGSHILLKLRDQFKVGINYHHRWVSISVDRGEDIFVDFCESIDRSVCMAILKSVK